MCIITYRCRRFTGHHCHRLACLHIRTRHCSGACHFYPA
ncbi:hypothetical protein BRUCa_0001 [Brucella melitensis]|nr:No hit [Brucella canis HSK A52141]AEW16667.1 hypothetical protein BAA13334_I00473 [Brucella abortus A13334]AIB18689.1 Hypothetical protein BSSP3_I1990 [Brucella suis bv. 2]AIB22075.1 Hypothetical protein BSPT1_I2002 [Brucella suis bv. 2]AIB25430.1 Hypothetical protein BSPT2_I1987 [Brucella suis bv. 2]